MNDDYQKGISGNSLGIQASKKKHEQHQANWKEVNKLSLFHAAKASAAFLCQQNRWSVCHGIGCNISPKHPTIPLNIVIEREKQRLTPVPENNDSGYSLLFYISPNDLVYLPTEDERSNNSYLKGIAKDQVQRVYKMVSSSGYQCFFVRHDIATSIVNKFEFGSLNKMEKSVDGIMIKEFCIKIKTDRLGNILPK